MNWLVLLHQGDGGGSIRINAANLDLSQGSQLLAGISGTSTEPNAQAGDITINVSDTISLGQNSLIANNIQPNGLGNAGNIQLNATNISLSGDSHINSLTFAGSEGNTGNLILNATNNIQLDDSIISTQIQEGATGNAGNIEVQANALAIVSSGNIITSRILNNTLGNGNAGNIEINITDNILLDRGGIASQVSSGNTLARGNAGTITIDASSATFQNRSEILSDTNGIGNAGNIEIDTRENIFLDGNTLIISQIRPGSQGNAGNITISAGETFSSQNFSFVSTNVQEGGIGQGGELTIGAKDVILTDGAILDALTENVTDSNNDGGNINITAQTLELTAGGKIITGTDGNGNAGSINLQISDRIAIDGENAPNRPTEFPAFEEQLLNDLETETGLFANTTEISSGDGGSINIQNPTSFTIINGGQVTVNSEGSGNGGSLMIQTNSLTLDNQAELLAATQFGQEAQDLSEIRLQIDDTLSLRGDSQISAQAFNNANGGNINIEATFVIAFAPQNQGNDIIANAVSGNGGRITIGATEILGLQEKSSISGNQTNDIDASSEFGFDGSVSLETPDIGATKGLVQLTQDIVEVNERFASVCGIERVAEGSSFTIQGKGGIPPQPIETFTAESLLLQEDSSQISQLRQKTDLESTRQKQYPPIMTNQGAVYPARGLVIGENGKIILTRYPMGTNEQRILTSAQDCS